MSTILEKCNQIKYEKDTEILPQNVRAGVQIFDINGEYEGLDTSNATATASDILAGKTAYVDGEMITGDIMSYSGVDVDAVNAGSWADEQIIYANGYFASTAVLEKDGTLGVRCPFGYIANAIGLTSNQITAGNNVLGIDGTAQVGELTEEEYNSAISTTEYILGLATPKPTYGIHELAQVLVEMPDTALDVHEITGVSVSSPSLTSDYDRIESIMSYMRDNVPEITDDADGIILSLQNDQFQTIMFGMATWYRQVSIYDPNDASGVSISLYSLSPSMEVPTGEWIKEYYDAETGSSNIVNVTNDAFSINFGNTYDHIPRVQLTISDRLRTQEVVEKILDVLQFAFNCTISYNP